MFERFLGGAACVGVVGTEEESGVVGEECA